MSTIERGPAERFRLERDLLRRIMHGEEELRLGDVCRRMDALLKERGEANGCTARAVSRSLRALGFEKIGMTGSGYDREPLYRRAAASMPV